MSCSIWISDADKKEIINAVCEHDELTCDALFDGHEIDELYIESDGALYGFINIGPIGVSVNIPFEEWFGLFKKYKAWDELRQQIEKRIVEQEVTLGELKNMFAYHCSVETIIEKEG